MLRIIVEGGNGEGKTTLARIIAEALILHNIPAEVIDDEPNDIFSAPREFHLARAVAVGDRLVKQKNAIQVKVVYVKDPQDLKTGFGVRPSAPTAAVE